jgi:glycosyltransferase involved in cell wall biosynthesis
MKIGINLIQYIDIQGIEVFTKNLLVDLVKQGSEHEFVFFVNQESAKIFDIKEHNVKIIIKHFKKISKIKLILYQQFGLIRKLKKEKINLLYCPSVAIPIFYKKKIVTIHDCASLRFKDEVSLISKLYLKLSFWSIKNLSLKIVTVSEFSKLEINKLLKISLDKIIVISEGVPNLVNINEDIIDKTLNKFNLKNKNYFLYIGNQRPRKNIPNLIKAWNDFFDKNNNYYLVMAGKINNLENFKINNIYSIGTINEEEKTSLYKMSRALIFPSLYEGFGLPVLEAQSLGIPVITSNISSLPEISGEGAILINPEDYKDISLGLEKIINPSFNKEELINKGYENLKKFSWNKTVSILLKIIKEI